MISSLLSKSIILGFLAYPLVSYFSILNQHPVYISHYLALIFGLLSVLNLCRQNIRQSVIFIIISISIGLIGLFGHPRWIIYPLPIVVLTLVALVFLNSLKDGNTPYITHMAQLIRKQQLDQKVLKYTRNVTTAWTFMFIALAVEMVALSLFAPLYLWSYMVNFLNYVLIAIFFIIEYIIRRLHLRHIPHVSFIQFIKNLIQANQTT